MRKIPTVFKRDPENMQLVIDEVNPGCEWVLAGEGVATVKFDGTCCMVEGGTLYKRREYKDGQDIPEDFRESEYDSNTGKHFGWQWVDMSLPENKWHWEAWKKQREQIEDGTYELCGPKINGNRS